jgi:enoyl-CoA hydratase
MFEPDEAATAGFLDKVVPPDEIDRALSGLIEALKDTHLPSHRAAKVRLRSPAMAAVRSAIDEELTLQAYQNRELGSVKFPR